MGKYQEYHNKINDTFMDVSKTKAYLDRDEDFIFWWIKGNCYELLEKGDYDKIDEILSDFIKDLNGEKSKCDKMCDGYRLRLIYIQSFREYKRYEVECDDD